VATEDLTRALDEAEAAYELFPHAHTESALAEAEALGLSPDDVAKALIVKTHEGYLRAVVQASGRLDERKVRDLTGGSKKDVHLATEDDLRGDYPEFVLGSVPPAGGARRDPVIVDSRVAARESVARKPAPAAALRSRGGAAGRWGAAQPKRAPGRNRSGTGGGRAVAILGIPPLEARRSPT
jgi:Ala-tRNA(Pro) deacylase